MKMAQIDQNIDLISRHHPYMILPLKSETNGAVNIIEAKNGLPTAEYLINNRKIMLHSRVDPQKEALLPIEGVNFVIVFGFALGYHISELIKKLRDDVTLVIIEKNAAVFDSALKNLDLSEILKRPNTFFLIGYPEEKSISAINFLISYPESQNFKFKILKHRPSLSGFENYYNAIEEKINFIFTENYSNILTEKKLGLLWTRNFKKNLPAISKSLRVNRLFNRFTNKPALLVGAGSSLNKYFSSLKRLNSVILTFAVDTAIKPLLKNKIIPDFVVSLDGQYQNFLDFTYLPTENLNLIADVTVNPLILKYFKGRKIFSSTLKIFKNLKDKPINSYHPEIQKFIESSGEIGGIQCGGNVTSSCFDIMRNLGCNPIILLGCDFAYHNYKSHVNGTFRDEYYLKANNKFKNIEGLVFKSIWIRNPALLYEDRENIFLTDFMFKKYKKWFSDAASILKMNLFNINSKILNVKNWKTIGIEEAEDMLANTPKPDIDKIFDNL